MANGDAAAAAGLPVVPSTKDIRQGYDDINRLADYVAAHMVSGGHSWDKIGARPVTYPSDWATTAGRPTGGVLTGATNADGAISVAHDLGRTPTWAHATLGGVPMGTINEEVSLYADIIIWRLTDTEVEFRVRRLDTLSWFRQQGLTIIWTAG